MNPQVQATFESSLIIECVALQYGIAHVSRVICYAHNAIATILQVECQQLLCLGFLGFLFLTVFLLAVLIVLFLVFLCILLGLFQLLLVFLTHSKAIVSIHIEEHHIVVALGAPAAVTAISGTVAFKKHGLATKHPTGRTLVVATLGKVMHLAISAGIYQGNVAAVPTASTYIAGQQPLAVRTPLKPQVAITVRKVVLTIKHGALPSCLQVNNAELRAVLEVSHLLAIRTVLWLQRSLVTLCQSLLIQGGSVSKEFLVLILQFGLIYLPYSTTLCAVHQTASVGGEVHTALLLWRIGNLLGCLILNRSYEDVTTQNKSHLFGIRRETYFCYTARAELAYQILVLSIGRNTNIYLLWLRALLQSIYLAILAVAERSFIAYRQIAYGIHLVVRELLFARTIDIAAIHVEGTIFLAGIIIRVGIGPAWCTVLALKISQACIVSILHHPDVATYRTLMMLAEGILVAFIVVIQHTTILCKADILHRQS